MGAVKRLVALERGKPRPTAVIAVAIVVLVVVALILNSGGGGANSGKPPLHTSIATVSQAGLKTVAATLHGPIYWAGPRPGVKYELTQISNGQLFVRYLPPNQPAGSRQPHLFVATFPFRNAYTETSIVADRPDSVKLPVGPNAIAFYSRSSPTNVYLAFTGSNYQIEVYDPDAAAGAQLVTSGAIRPVAAGATASSTVVAASLSRLQHLPAQLRHVVYWAGPIHGTKYELTETPSGSTFIRYLSPSAPIGSKTAYLFVGTLPTGDAFAATSRAAAGRGKVKLPIGGGGVAFYGKSRPTNIYAAFPGSSFQIEVYDPNPAQARTLLSTGKIGRLP